MEENCDNIPSTKENMEGSANDMIASTSEQNVEGSDNIASTSNMVCFTVECVLCHCTGYSMNLSFLGNVIMCAIH